MKTACHILFVSMMGWAVLAPDAWPSDPARVMAPLSTTTTDAFSTPTLSIRYEPLYYPGVRYGFFRIPRFILFRQSQTSIDSFFPGTLFPEGENYLLPADEETGSSGQTAVLEWNWEQAEKAKSQWAWDVSTATITLRPEGDATLATRSPVLLTLTRTIGPNTWESFRPMVSAGLGILNQTREGREYGERQYEFLPIWYAGIGAEWEPFEDLILRFNYDYTQSPVESSLMPQLPTRSHSLQMGVELRF